MLQIKLKSGVKDKNQICSLLIINLISNFTSKTGPEPVLKTTLIRRRLWCNVGALSLSPLSFTSLVRTGGIVQCSPGMASCSSCVITGNTNRWSMASLKSALPPPSLRFPTMAAATSFQSKPKPKSKLLLRSFNGLAPLQPSLFPTSCPGTFHHYPLF